MKDDLDDVASKTKTNTNNIESLADQVDGLGVIASSSGELSQVATQMNRLANQQQLHKYQQVNDMMVSSKFMSGHNLKNLKTRGHYRGTKLRNAQLTPKSWVFRCKLNPTADVVKNSELNKSWNRAKSKNMQIAHANYSSKHL